jgi:peptidyl-prolyl cis-trans isomerase SurA
MSSRDDLPRPRQTALVEVLALVIGAGAVAATGVVARAQQSLPGIVITGPQPGGYPPGVTPPMPPPGGGAPPPALAMPPPAVAPPPPEAKPKPRPKPKPRVAARPKAPDEGSGSSTGTHIAVLVNGQPITGYEIDQRARLLGLQADIGSKAQVEFKRLATTKSVSEDWKRIVQGIVEKYQRTKTREQIIAIIRERQKSFSGNLQVQAMAKARASVLPGLKSKARQELIEETVKLQAAKSAGAAPDETAVDAVIKDIAGRNKMTPAQFAKHLSGMGIDINAFKARFRVQQAWAEAVRRKYGHLATPNNLELDRLIGKDIGGEDQIEMQLQRIVIPIPPKLDQRSMAQRLAEAEQLHRQFKNCRTTSLLANKVPGARFENLGTKLASSFQEPIRTMLLNAKDNEMIPPTMTSGGVEMIAVCERQVVKAGEEKRNQKANELRQEQFERLARKHLKDLMDVAVIENR